MPRKSHTHTITQRHGSPKSAYSGVFTHKCLFSSHKSLLTHGSHRRRSLTALTQSLIVCFSILCSTLGKSIQFIGKREHYLRALPMLGDFFSKPLISSMLRIKSNLILLSNLRADLFHTWEDSQHFDSTITNILVSKCC